MNTKVLITALECAMSHVNAYCSLEEKLAALTVLQIVCTHPNSNQPSVPLREIWHQIMVQKTEINRVREEQICQRERLLTTFPGVVEEEAVFDVVPEELQEEVKAMDAELDLVPNDAMVVPNPVNTVLDMAREILTPNELQQAIDRTQRVQTEPIIYEPTAEALKQIIQQKREAFVTHTNTSPHEALSEEMFGAVKDNLHKFGVPTPQGRDSDLT